MFRQQQQFCGTEREREREFELRNASLERTEGEEEVRGGQGRTGEESSG